MRSLRARLFVVWMLSLAAAVAVGALMLQIYGRSTSLAEGRAQDLVAGACDQIRDAYRYYGAGWTPAAAPTAPVGRDPVLARDLGAVLAISLGDDDAVRGGVWEPTDGLIARFPADAADFPRPEAWRGAVTNAADAERDAFSSSDTGAEQIVVAACPLPGPIVNLVGFAATRVTSRAGLTQLQLGLGVLFVLVLAISGCLTWLVASWSRHVGKIETALAGHAVGALPHLDLTGERELDRIVGALNLASARVETAQREAADAGARLASSEKLAALGRVAAGVAHEIRNPIAAMRLRAENALAGDDARRRGALEGILGQIARLDRLLAEMLAMTQSRDPERAEVDLARFLDDCVREHADAAAGGGVRLQAKGEGTASFDASMLRRAISNLLQNAIRETPRGGRVDLRGCVENDVARITVADSGKGVPVALVDRLFEPFVTGRADGTGLGLAIARELVTAHGGALGLAASENGGATFLIEIPGAAADPFA